MAWVKSPRLENPASDFQFVRSLVAGHFLAPQETPVYADEGWVSWGDRLGSGRIATYTGSNTDRLSRARAFARSLGLKNRDEWLAAEDHTCVERDNP
jgi:hypothetical protein